MERFIVEVRSVLVFKRVLNVVNVCLEDDDDDVLLFFMRIVVVKY